ncbi:MAG: cation transporter [Polyangiaceae bacterium]|nr:cation transporter [Polyangiaceae bacterium]
MMVLSIAAALTTMALKYSAWALTGSVGLFSDAAESSVNLVAALFGLYALRVSAQPPDANHAFGHHKVEYFASALEGVLILIAAATIIYAAAMRIRSPAPLADLGVGLLISLGAAGVNAAVAFAMMRVAKREDSIVLEADAHHLLTDVWTSFGILAGLAIVFFIPRAAWLDPAIAIVVALNIARVGYVLVRRSIDGLMDVSLPLGEKQQIEQAVRVVLPERAAMAHLRTLKAGSIRFVYFDLLLPGEMTVTASHELCDRLEAAIGAELSPCRVSIHVEPLEPEHR